MNAEADAALKRAKAFIDAMARKDAPAMHGMLHDECLLESVYPLMKGENTPGARICRGAGVRTYITEVLERVAQIQFKNVVWRTTSDGLAMLEADGDLTYPDGRPYQNHYLMMFGLKDGQIHLWREFFNPVIWAKANGVTIDALPT